MTGDFADILCTYITKIYIKIFIANTLTSF